MSKFKGAVQSGVLIWTGDPDCDAAHSSLLVTLQTMRTRFLGPAEIISHRQEGNLGEFICLQVSMKTPLGATEKFAQNALDPLQDISAAGVDLAYVYFDDNPSKNLLYIQEIKTTSNPLMTYADNLKADYKKLFGNDLDLTLLSRIQSLANRFEIERNRPDLVDRVLALGADTPQSCTRVHLLPTAVHERNGANPVQKMLAIRTAITAFGWNAAAITPWAIGLTELQDRLLRLARGQD